MYVPAPNDKQFELPPAGTHLATCYRVIDLGTQNSTYMGQAKRQHKIMLGWELSDELMTDGRPFMISQRYTWSMSEKAALRRDLESWRGIPFQDKDFGEGGFDIKNVLGKPCLLNVVHVNKNGKDYANIASISRLMKGQKGPEKTVNETVYLWLHPERWDSATFMKLSDGLKGVIMQSPEYAAVANGHVNNDDEPPPVDANEYGAFDDAIPF